MGNAYQKYSVLSVVLEKSSHLHAFTVPIVLEKNLRSQYGEPLKATRSNYFVPLQKLWSFYLSLALLRTHLAISTKHYQDRDKIEWFQNICLASIHVSNTSNHITATSVTRTFPSLSQSIVTVAFVSYFNERKCSTLSPQRC